MKSLGPQGSAQDISTVERAQAVRNLRHRLPTNVFADCHHGRYSLKAALTTPETHTIIYTLAAADAYAFQPLLPNVGPAISGVKVQLCVLTAYGDSTVPLIPPGAVWENCTQNGSTSITMTASPSSEIVEFTQLDWKGKKSLARTDGDLRVLVGLRVQFPQACQPSLPANNLYYTRITGRDWHPQKVAFQGVAGIDTPSSLTVTASSNEGGFMPAFIYASTRLGDQIILGGDSIDEGLGPDCRGMGPVSRAAYLLSTPDKPVVIFNCAQHAQSPNTYAVSLAKHIPMVRPNQIYYKPATGNNTNAPAGLVESPTLEEDRLGLARIFDAVRKLDYRPPVLLIEMLPSKKAYKDFGANDALRDAFNASLVNYGSDPFVYPAVTYKGLVMAAVSINQTGATKIEGYSASISQAYVAGAQTEPKTDAIGADNVHPNETGVTRDLTPPILPYMYALFQRQ